MSWLKFYKDKILPSFLFIMYIENVNIIVSQYNQLQVYYFTDAIKIKKKSKYLKVLIGIFVAHLKSLN